MKTPIVWLLSACMLLSTVISVAVMEYEGQRERKTGRQVRDERRERREQRRQEKERGRGGEEHGEEHGYHAGHHGEEEPMYHAYRR